MGVAECVGYRVLGRSRCVEEDCPIIIVAIVIDAEYHSAFTAIGADRLAAATVGKRVMSCQIKLPKTLNRNRRSRCY